MDSAQRSGKPTADWMDELRQEAERLMAKRNQPKPVIQAFQTDELLEELQIHQIELEMQNEALRQSQLELEQSRDRYQDLYDFAPVGYLTLTRTGLIQEANLTCGKLLGKTRSELIKRYFASLIAREDADRWYLFLTNALKTDEGSSIDLTLQLTEDTPISVRLVSTRLWSDSKVVGLRIAFTDIGAHKQAENELRIAAIAFESSQEPMMVTDSAGVILRLNSAFIANTGYSAEEVVGKTPALLKSGRHDKQFYKKLWTTLKEEGSWRGTIWNRAKNGKIYAEWLTLTAVRDEQGVINHYVATYSPIAKNREAEAEIHRLAYYDPLTQLPNRRLLHDRIQQTVAICHRSGNHGALLYLDLDNFKSLNDRSGHEAGDQLLTHVAQRIEAGIRKDNTVARLSGDEFVIVLDELSPDSNEAMTQARALANSIRHSLGQPFDLKGTQFQCTASIGIVLFYGPEHEVKGLLKQADLALYQAKNAGGNTVIFFDPSLQNVLNQRNATLQELKQAIHNSELRLYYQVQVDHLYRVTSVEALIRWHHPTRGLLEPDAFIPLAEESGLIFPIGNWVLSNACHQIKSWSDKAGFESFKLSVNVCARQFHQTDFVDDVRRALAESGANPKRLRIELTESVVINDLKDTITKMHELKALGISLSMDDFGTGYSSLSTLSCLPLDQLKIDQSFVQKLDTNQDENNAIVTQSIIMLGQTLGLQVIAEGVETYGQLDFLERHGCNAYQGFLFSRPLTLDKLEHTYPQ